MAAGLAIALWLEDDGRVMLTLILVRIREGCWLVVVLVVFACFGWKVVLYYVLCQVLRDLVVHPSHYCMIVR